jgi:hypothetical protein
VGESHRPSDSLYEASRFLISFSAWASLPWSCWRDRFKVSISPLQFSTAMSQSFSSPSAFSRLSSAFFFFSFEERIVCSKVDCCFWRSLTRAWQLSVS